jgi:hypothetical protein
MRRAYPAALRRLTLLGSGHSTMIALVMHQHGAVGVEDLKLEYCLKRRQ